MSPTARSELRSYAKRVRKEARQRDRQFAPKNADTGFVLGIFLGITAVALVGALWLIR